MYVHYMSMSVDMYVYIYRRSTVLVCMYMYAYTCTSFSITVSTAVVGGVLCRPALGARPRGSAGQTHPRPAGQQPLRHCHSHHRAASVEVRGQIRLMVIVNVGTPGIQEHVSAMCSLGLQATALRQWDIMCSTYTQIHK